jgi:hypothetical protein
MPRRPPTESRGSTRKLLASRPSSAVSYANDPETADDVLGSPTHRLSRASSRGSIRPLSPSPPPTGTSETFAVDGLTPLDETCVARGLVSLDGRDTKLAQAGQARHGKVSSLPARPLRMCVSCLSFEDSD